jgi:ribosomal protein S7
MVQKKQVRGKKLFKFTYYPGQSSKIIPNKEKYRAVNNALQFTTNVDEQYFLLKIRERFKSSFLTLSKFNNLDLLISLQKNLIIEIKNIFDFLLKNFSKEYLKKNNILINDNEYIYLNIKQLKKEKKKLLNFLEGIKILFENQQEKFLQKYYKNLNNKILINFYKGLIKIYNIILREIRITSEIRFKNIKKLLKKKKKKLNLKKYKIKLKLKKYGFGFIFSIFFKKNNISNIYLYSYLKNISNFLLYNKLINLIMYKGEKYKAEKIVLKSLEILKTDYKILNSLDLFKFLLYKNIISFLRPKVVGFKILKTIGVKLTMYYRLNYSLKLFVKGAKLMNLNMSYSLVCEFLNLMKNCSYLNEYNIQVLANLKMHHLSNVILPKQNLMTTKERKNYFYKYFLNKSNANSSK